VRVVFVGRDRGAWRCILLSLVTLGIWRRVWLHRVHKEIDGHDALGVRHDLMAVLLCLPIGGPAVVSFLVARRAAAMMAASPVRYGPPAAVGLAVVVPILGNLFHLGWTQSRLNRFWAHERAHPGRGLEVDVELGADPAFLVELQEALKASYHAGSRFGRRAAARKTRWQARARTFGEVQRERAAVRAAGGSTPVLPFLRPQRPAPRKLKVTCGRCRHAFELVADPTAETRLLCPSCGLAEVLPALSSNPLAPAEPARLPVLRVKCPACKTQFQAVHELAGPTQLTCPKCGRQDTLPPARGLAS
jgi:ribosomal protein S27E